MTLQINEHEIKKIFEHPSWEQKFWIGLKSFLRYTLSFSFLFGLFFVLINFPAYWQKITFGIQGEEKFSSTLTEEERLVLEPLKKIEPQKPLLSAEFLPQNRLLIPKLKINAPIMWNASNGDIINKLKEGVAHYEGTSLPGENGNVFITGHSSNFWWDEGLFKQVFALLDKLENNDKIFITYNQQLYIYQVESQKVVNPSQIEVLNPTDHSIVSLMTCYPVGTTINRLVVMAKQIYPESGQTINQRTIDADFLPVIR